MMMKVFFYKLFCIMFSLCVCECECVSVCILSHVYLNDSTCTL